MSVKDWLITLVILIIPIIGFVMLFVWAFGSGNNINKANYAKASLILVLIFIGLGIIFSVVFGAFIAQMMGTGVSY
ncbi:MAG: hypothetical protein ACFCUU_09085 [Cyclobacteriaceae bacterium]